MNIKIKPGQESKAVSFGKGSGPIGERSKEELVDLAIIAQESQDPSILDLFEDLPALTVLQKHKTDQKLKDLTEQAKIPDVLQPESPAKTIQDDQGAFKGTDPNERNQKSPAPKNPASNS